MIYGFRGTFQGGGAVIVIEVMTITAYTKHLHKIVSLKLSQILFLSTIIASTDEAITSSYL